MEHKLLIDGHSHQYAVVIDRGMYIFGICEGRKKKKKRIAMFNHDDGRSRRKTLRLTFPLRFLRMNSLGNSWKITRLIYDFQAPWIRIAPQLKIRWHDYGGMRRELVTVLRPSVRGETVSGKLTILISRPCRSRGVSDWRISDCNICGSSSRESEENGKTRRMCEMLTK